MRLVSRRLISLLAALALLATSPAQALDPATSLRDYHHTSWTSKDGAPAEITSMAQTPDGWLWLGTPSGIYRFDGVRFEPYVPPAGSKLLHSRISTLVALPNGDLLIGYIDPGMSVRHANGQLQHFTQAQDDVSNIYTMVRDVDDSLWAATTVGFRHLVQGRWQRIGQDAGIKDFPSNILLDQHANLYVAADLGVFRLDRKTRRFDRVDPAPSSSVFEAPNGQIWTGVNDLLKKLPTPAPTAPRTNWANQAEGRSNSIFDRDGNLWTLRCPVGLCLVRGADKLAGPIVPSRDASDNFDQSWQVSSLSTNLLLEDQAGNIMLSTQAGLDRFRNSAMLAVKIAGADGFYVMTPGANGEVWVTDRRTHNVWRVAPGKAPQRYQKYRYVTARADGTLVFATDDGLEWHDGGRVERFPWPSGAGVLSVHAILDDGRYLWARLNARGSFVLVDGQWKKPPEVMPTTYSVRAVSGVGKVWFVSNEELISQFDNGTIRAQWTPEQHGITAVSGIFADSDVLLAGENGVAVLQGSQWRKLHADQPEVLSNVTGMTTSANGDRWLNGRRGVLHITRADWQAAMAQPQQPLRYDLFDAADGYAGEAATGVWDNTALTDSNGHLWFASTAGLWRLDPAKLWRTKATPRAEIMWLQTAVAHPPQDGLRLQPGTSQLRVDYTGLGSAKPEKLRFHYRLDGVDDEWQQAGDRRSAYYTNLGPGNYRFHLRVVNEDGIWSKETSTGFEIAPTVVQSSWFKGLLLLLAAVLLYLLHRYRLHVNTRRALERIALRADERENIARDLHDTLLQSMQGVIYNVKALAMDLPPQEPMRHAMERTVQLATDALVEGRDRVSDLRLADGELTSLADALRAVGSEQGYTAPGFEVHSEGEERELHPLVRDQLLLMARECLLNAFRHAQASEVKVVLQWSERALRLAISDNGVGIAPAIVTARGKPGHWGMGGLYERASHLQAQLKLETGSTGTVWRMSVPAALAYRRRAIEADA